MIKLAGPPDESDEDGLPGRDEEAAAGAGHERGETAVRHVGHLYLAPARSNIHNTWMSFLSCYPVFQFELCFHDMIQLFISLPPPCR